MTQVAPLEPRQAPPPEPPDIWPEEGPATRAAPEPGNLGYSAGVLRAIMDGRPVNGHLSRLPDDLRDLAEAMESQPPAGELRAVVLKAELGKLADKPRAAAIMRAVLAADPPADLNELLPRPKTFDDIAQMLGPISWEWEGWLAAGFVTILASESGTGKSALTLALCDCYLRGKPWPDGSKFTGQKGAVLWCEAEAAQAINLERSKGWGLPTNRLYTPLENPLEDLNLDLPEHKAALIEKARRDDVRLIVVDSLSGADPKAEKSTEDATTIKWLAELARDTGKPILVTHHLRKRSLFDGDTISLDRLRGSSAIVQTARVVWALDTPDPQAKEWRRLQVVKSNLAAFPESLGITITAAGVRFGAAPQEPKTEGVLERAVDLLMALLQGEPMSAREIEDEFDQAGISKPTMKRAKSRLGIVSIKTKDGWKWGLPAQAHSGPETREAVQRQIDWERDNDI